MRFQEITKLRFGPTQKLFLRIRVKNTKNLPYSYFRQYSLFTNMRVICFLPCLCAEFHCGLRLLAAFLHSFATFAPPYNRPSTHFILICIDTSYFSSSQISKFKEPEILTSKSDNLKRNKIIMQERLKLPYDEIFYYTML